VLRQQTATNRNKPQQTSTNHARAKHWFLRGGSGGGGGSDYSGGGSDYSGSGSDDYDPIQNFLWFLVDLSLVILHIATCLKKCGVFGESRNIGSDTGFDQAVCNAQLGLGFSQQVNISYGTLVNNATPNFETYEGDFDMIYNDRGTRRSGSVKIQLNSNGVDMKLMEALAMLMDALQ